MRPDARRKLAMAPQDDPYRSIRRHAAAALVLLLLIFFAASVAWLSAVGTSL